ncbi:MAG: 4-(cytidine 5'-diphospho)-2-C-methyl-D-erythritol kinase [Bacteroidetes bacterium]|nr:4-(cytidine 5'-diphospho)-2-C-methyl-D-erythritol kinase [Bacteroidota bacterium]
MDKIVVNSPAKINLGLNLFGKRNDGFHNLETIFYPLKLADKIHISKTDDFIFTTNNSSLSSGTSNLVIKVKDLLENFTKEKINCNIYLEKNIPIGAGLGGGSSNAAVTLKALNKLFNLNLSNKTLLELALTLGSDIPFFLNPVPSFATSRGEILKEISLKLKGYLLLVYPGVHISTKWAFENCIPKNNKIQVQRIIKKMSLDDDFSDLLTNDFEEIVFAEYPQIKEIKERLIEMGAYFTLMTGTGSSVYGIFHNKDKVEIAKEKFPKESFTYIEEL